MAMIKVENRDIKISNPEKMLWPELEIRKIDYITTLIKLSPYILPYSSNRLLTTIRYPDGVAGKYFYQKSIPKYAPPWIDKFYWHDTAYIVLNCLSTLVWLGNQAALELHISFNSYHEEDNPSHVVIDLDPSKDQPFEEVIEAALLINEILTSLGIKSWAKTSGATGLQIYIPTAGVYDYPTSRKINEFLSKYFSQKYPSLFTIERVVNKRGKKLYFDYLQMWYGKTITAPYSPRATPWATISTPIEWKELKKGLTPRDFTLLNIMDRLEKKGDLFKQMAFSDNTPSLDNILSHLGQSTKTPKPLP